MTDHPANDGVSSFSSDGRSIYFNSNRTGVFEIWKVPTAGGETVQVTHNTGYIAFESPDGAYPYYTQTLAAPSPLWRVPARPCHQPRVDSAVDDLMLVKNFR